MLTKLFSTECVLLCRRVRIIGTSTCAYHVYVPMSQFSSDETPQLTHMIDGEYYTTLFNLLLPQELKESPMNDERLSKFVCYSNVVKEIECGIIQEVFEETRNQENFMECGMWLNISGSKLKSSDITKKFTIINPESYWLYQACS